MNTKIIAALGFSLSSVVAMGGSALPIWPPPDAVLSSTVQKGATRAIETHFSQTRTRGDQYLGAQLILSKISFVKNPTQKCAHGVPITGCCLRCSMGQIAEAMPRADSTRAQQYMDICATAVSHPRAIEAIPFVNFGPDTNGQKDIEARRYWIYQVDTIIERSRTFQEFDRAISSFSTWRPLPPPVDYIGTVRAAAMTTVDPEDPKPPAPSMSKASPGPFWKKRAKIAAWVQDFRSCWFGNAIRVATALRVWPPKTPGDTIPFPVPRPWPPRLPRPGK